MKMLMKTQVFVLVIAGLMLGSVAVAQNSLRLENRAEQWEAFTDEAGVERQRLVEAAKVLPGESVVFTITYTNTGDEPAEDITITNPVPEHMDYVDGSATGDDAVISYSVDGGESFGASQDLAVADTTGTLRRATAADYTHVRWVVGSDVAPDTGGEVKFTAVVE